MMTESYTSALNNNWLFIWRLPCDALVGMAQHGKSVEYQKYESIQAQYERQAEGLRLNAVWCELFDIPGEAWHDTSASQAGLPTWGHLREA
jgi:hypothetical protein